MNRTNWLKERGMIILLALITGAGQQLKAQDNLLCQGRHWTEDEGAEMMAVFQQEWHDQASWEKRANRIKQGLIEGMQLDQMPPRSTEFNVRISHARKMDGYWVENIVLESFPGFYITGNLYRPVDLNGKCAAILCPHGHLPDKRLKEDVQTRATAFARMGAVVFAYDMVGFADSKQVTHDIPIALVLQTYNSQRVLDYLLSRADVDAERVGITGGSGGGTQTFMLTAIDDRITVAAPVVQVSAHFFGGCVCESGMPVHKSADHQTNNVEIAALCAPRPLLLISNGADWTRNTPAIEFPYVKRVYEAYGVPHRVEHVHLPLEKHDYGPSKRAAAYNFFAHHLKLNLNKLPYKNGFDERFVHVFQTDELRVYSADNPLPANALKGNQAVMDYLGIWGTDSK
ncbi:hypothetical protein [Sunxiuqinia rutila]|uniref:alpha/beta hydrolase n=1 Tax=Sunxiuqinia rutila TaxID=1397841 RepID=UPI003D369DA9